jgi:membrane protease subunit (stomatin/prohibitin family)
VLGVTKTQTAEYGLEIVKLANVNISLKEEDEATLKQMTRDFAYSENKDAADAAVKLGMADGMKNSTGAGSSAADAAATGMGIAMGMEAMKKKDEEPKDE